MATITTGKYLKADDLTEDGTVHAVESIEQADLKSNDGGTEKKWLLTLSGLKPLILNTTNINRCVAAFGTQETDEWIGKKIIAYADPNVEYGGKIIGGVRLKAMPKPTPKVKAAPVVDDISVDDIPF